MTNRHIYKTLISKDGARLRVKKSKKLAVVNLNILSNTALPIEIRVTNTIKLKINVNVFGSTYSNKRYIKNTIIGNKIKLIPNTL